MTKKGFEVLAQSKVSERASYIMAIYATLDGCQKEELSHSGITLACEKGCAICCHQMISCTKPEMDEIISFIARMEKKARRALKKRLEVFVRDHWEPYYQQKKMTLRQNPFSYVADWLGRPCPFLIDGVCIIYPVRIIDCRALSSLTKCVDFETSGAKRLRFDPEMWANNLILEYQEKRFGFQSVTLLGQWLLLFKNNYWQPIKDNDIELAVWGGMI